MACLATLPADARPAAERGIALVELYTSEGCSSCPPADALLGRVVADAERGHLAVYALAFHVDYWDHLGWRDRFSSPVFTERQNAYARRFGLASLYTPQMVVNGEVQAVGSDRGDIESALKKVAATPASGPSLSLERKGDGALAVHVGAGKSGSATVWLACFDREHTTAVTRGENAGSTLTNYRVVRHFESIGAWKGDALDLTVPAEEMAEYMKRPDQSVAVLVQSDEIGPILAASVLSAKGR